MTLQVSARATESARPSGTSSGGGAAQTIRKPESEKGESPDRSHWPEIVPGSGPEFGVSLAALLGAERPVEAQARAIDERNATIESSKRRSPHPASQAKGSPGALSGADQPMPRDVTRPHARETDPGDASPSVMQSSSRPSTESFGARAGALGLSTESAIHGTTHSADGSDGIGADRPDAAAGSAEAGFGVAANQDPRTSSGRVAGMAARGSAGSGALASAHGQQNGSNTTTDHGAGREALARLVSMGQVSRSNGAAGPDAAPSARPFSLEAEPTPGAQVDRGLAQLLKGNGGTVTLRLRPEHLGEVRASVSVERGQVDVRIEATSEEARALLERETGSLRAALESRGLRVEHVRVEVASRSDPTPEAGQEDHAERGVDHEGGDRPGAEEWRHEERGAHGSASRSAEARIPDSVSAGGFAPDVSFGAAAGTAVVMREQLGGVLRLDAVA